MKQVVSSYDAIIAEDFDLKKYPFPNNKRDVYEYWKELDNLFIDYKYVSILLDIISDKYPQYLETAKKYMIGQDF